MTASVALHEIEKDINRYCFYKQWNAWIEKYRFDNVKFAVGSIGCMKSLTVKYGYDEMVESYEHSLNQIEL